MAKYNIEYSKEAKQDLIGIKQYIKYNLQKVILIIFATSFVRIIFYVFIVSLRNELVNIFFKKNVLKVEKMSQILKNY